MRRAMTIPAVLLAAVTVAATPALAVYPDDQLIAHVRQAVIKHRLVDHPDCVDYVITRKLHPLIDQVELRERHDAKCGGDPGTAPRLFDVIVDRQNGQMATDASDPADGGMTMLK